MTRIRLLVAMSRPPVLLLLGLFAATGLAQAGHPEDPALLVRVLVAVFGFLLFSVLLNDLADEAIDRVNLPEDARRPLVAGTSNRWEFAAMAIAAAVLALASAATLSPGAAAVLVGGLVLSASYSLRPVRIADRGAVAAMLLPAGYVAVPYLVGVLAVRPSVTGRDLALLAGLYVGFIGRIVLKDFRDVRGDALFGKRTFLVRHGRVRTCQLSAACWVAGAATLLAVDGVSLALAAAYAVFIALALALLRSLAVDRGTRRDEALISAIALVGRGMIVTLLAHFSLKGAGWSPPAYTAAMAAVTVLVVATARTMARTGPATRLTVPFADIEAKESVTV